MKPDISKFPDLPGVYLMKDVDGNIIYIGKAKALKKRVSQYFHSPSNLTTKTHRMVEKISSIDYIITSSEIEALILEANLIKKNRPHYNVDLKDDKRYPYIKITVKERYPRIFLTRRRLMDDAVYFGPYTSVKPVRKTLDMINQLFRIRKCRKRLNEKPQRACLNMHIDRCMGPCTGKVDREEYRKNVDTAVRFLKGDTRELLGMLTRQMEEYADKQQYEAAATTRDHIEALHDFEKQQRSTAGIDDQDVIGVECDEKNAFVQLFFVRNGTMVGRADFILNRGKAEIGEIISGFVEQYYRDSPVPPTIIVQEDPNEKEILEKWLTARAGKGVSIKTPVRGEKKKLIEMAKMNASMAMEREHSLKTTGASPDKALLILKEKIGLDTIPEHIEGFDISNISGTDAVGSMVVFRKGMPAKADYRLFNIKTVEGIDDFSMMAEVVGRRYRHANEDKKNRPDLILIDGGEGQVNAAQQALDDLGANIPLVGLAKRFEHIVFPRNAEKKVLILPHTSPALKLLMQVRDESHRFAVTSHRRKRSSRLSHSELDAVEGLGKEKKKALIQHFGSVEKIRRASEKEIMEVPGIGKKLASKIISHLKG
ncbi:excinuclease ABC subunit C [Methanohalophilus levihalophilus]|uniref:excinuclease ABC subunit UvrC n=1 Tax=Methanohalophilus levihalophilus TaxID=1431282 RepID=UPI001AE58057|nr:excinuclease ABC subunit UvrC [Methanohalophilus levihalophilus]MBP2030769.1 excinuclease ABC subunit C [Methanohalophilus levihalophilus]